MPQGFALLTPHKVQEGRTADKVHTPICGGRQSAADAAHAAREDLALDQPWYNAETKSVGKEEADHLYVYKREPGRCIVQSEPAAINVAPLAHLLAY